MDKTEKRTWGRHVLGNRLAAVVSVLMFASILINSVFIYRRYADDFAAQTSGQTQQILEQVSLNIEEYINELRRLCISPLYSAEVMKLLQSEAVTEQEKLDKRRTIEGFLRQEMTIPRDDITRVYIISSELYFSGRTGMPNDIMQSYPDEQWYQRVIDESEILFSPKYETLSTSPNDAVISAARRLNSLDNPDVLVGVIRVDANYRTVKSICDRVLLEKNSALYIADESNALIYHNTTLSPEFAGPDDFFNGADTFRQGSSSAVINNEQFLINVMPIPDTSWRIIACKSVSELTQGMRDAQIYIYLTTLLFSLLGIAMTLLAVRRFLTPLNETVKRMKDVQHGNMSVRASEKGSDEIAYLNRSFNKMLSQIQAMIEKDSVMQKRMFEAKYLQKEAQYDALYNQIQPHFLFNTLNTISLLIKMDRGSEAIICIDDLSVLLRGMANSERDITLKEELKIVASYLKLQQKRFDRLKFSISVSPDLEDYELPALTIQPIVENAVIHGAGKHGRLSIDIAVNAEDDQIIIIISDDGEGMDAGKLENLRETINAADDEALAKPGASIGLVNVNNRMKLKYGDRSRLSISSGLNKGTKVTLQLPMERGDFVVQYPDS